YLQRNELEREMSFGTLSAKGFVPAQCAQQSWTLILEMKKVTSTKTKTSSLILAKLTTFSLVLTLLGGAIMPSVASASSTNHSHSGKNSNDDKIGSDLRSQMKNQSGDTIVKVILQLDGKMSGSLNGLLSSNGVKVKKRFASFNSFAVELPLAVVGSLSNFS